MLDVKLETLLAVAESKNFTRAAQVLSLTQPAVSHHINQLEKEYNTKLFVRGKGDFKLTHEGKIAVTYAKRLKALNENMVKEIQNEQKHISRVKIGITHTSENNTITEVLAKYANLESRTTITLITDTINNLYSMLENFELDLAIVEGKRLSPHLNYFMLDTDYLVCVVSNDNPLAKHSMVTINQLKRENMILRLPTSDTRQLFEANLISNNESIENFDISMEIDNVATIKELVRKNLGVSILPKSACLKDANKGKLTIMPIENLSMMREMNIAYNKDFIHPEILRDIVDLYHKSIR